MQTPYIFLVLAVIHSLALVDAVSPGYRSLPWDGRAYNLTVDTITDKYLTPILVQRNGEENGNPADYVSVQYQTRPFGYNGDSGSLSIGVDGNAIYSTDTNVRRSDLFQNIEGSSDGTTFFRASVMKADAFLNAYDWKMIFLGSDLFHIGVDASVKPAMVYYRTNGTSDAKWSTEFTPGVWYNFGVGLEKSADGNNMVLEFYTSTGQDELVFNVTNDVSGQLRVLHDFHVGLFTQSSDGSAPVMNAQQDIIAFSAVSAEATAIDAGVPTPAPSMAVTSTSETAGEALYGESFTFDDRK